VWDLLSDLERLLILLGFLGVFEFVEVVVLSGVFGVP
jgi:hypothetical protein